MKRADGPRQHFPSSTRELLGDDPVAAPCAELGVAFPRQMVMLVRQMEFAAFRVRAAGDSPNVGVDEVPPYEIRVAVGVEYLFVEAELERGDGFLQKKREQDRTCITIPSNHTDHVVHPETNSVVLSSDMLCIGEPTPCAHVGGRIANRRFFADARASPNA